MERRNELASKEVDEFLVSLCKLKSCEIDEVVKEFLFWNSTMELFCKIGEKSNYFDIA